jgi:uncharacterized membrane protein
MAVTTAAAGDGVKPREYLESAPLETLVYGIFAISMTLLILDLRVPEHIRPGGMGSALRDLLPAAIAYSFGFAYLASYWLSTRRYFRRFTTIDKSATALLLAHVAAVSLTPVSVAMLAAARNSTHNLAVATVATAAQLELVAIFASCLVQWERRCGRLSTDFTRRRLVVDEVLMLGVPVVIAAGSLVQPWVGVAALMADVVYAWKRL